MPTFTIEEQITSQSLVVSNWYLELSLANEEYKKSLLVVNDAGTKEDTRNEQIILQSALLSIIDNTNFQFTSSLNLLTSYYDNKNIINPSAGFPIAGEKIIRVGDTVDVQWNKELVPDVNLFFIKGGVQNAVTVVKQQSDKSKSFVIDISHFSDGYLPCKIRMESTDISTVFDESPVFKVLKNN